MDEYENNDFIPEQPAPEAPRQEPQQEPQQEPRRTDPYTYHGSGAGRKESPYANSPYVMNHQPEQTHYTYQQEPAWQYQPQQEAPKPKKQKKQKRGIGRKILAAVLIVALVAGSCGATALLVNNHWEEKTQQMNANLSREIQNLQKQINSNAAAAVPTPGDTVASGDLLTPSQVYAANVNSVVSITCTIQSNSYYGGSAQGTSSGSGFILTEDGYVITNWHVVDGASDVSVSTNDGTEYPATVVGTYEANDIAVLKVDATGLPAVTIGSSDDLVIGDMVVAVGNALGTLASTQTVGYVSGKDRDVTTDGSIISMIQTDAAINSGNSGGPLFNMYGQVVGITTAKYTGTSGSGATIEGIGFAIPIDDVMGIISDLIDYGYVTGAYMGITVSNTDEESAAMFGLPVGAYVISVEKGGSADRAGIQPKDIIIDLGGYEVKGITTLTRALRNFKSGDTTTVTLIRSGARMELEITLDEKPQAAAETAPTMPESTEGMPSQGDPNEWFDYYSRFFGSQFGNPFGN